MGTKKTKPKSKTRLKLEQKAQEAQEQYNEFVKKHGPIERNVGGRPTKYEDWMCDAVIEKMALGFSKDAMAGFLGITKDTLYRWEKEIVRFSDSLKQGVELSRIFWEQKGNDLMRDIYLEKGESVSRGNASVWIFNMKNRFGWRENVEHEINQKVEHDIVINFTEKTQPDEN